MQVPIELSIFRSFLAKLIAGAIAFAIVATAAFFVPVTPPPVFEVAARIWVQSKMPTEGASASGGGTLSPFLSYFNSPINTAGEVMKSTLVLEEAIRELKKKLPAERLPGLGDLRGGLRVDPVRDADILIIYYRNNYAYVGVEVVQAVLDAFLRVNSAQAAVSAKESRIFLERQLEDYKKQMRQISEKVQAFKTAHGLLDLDGQTEAVLERIAGIEQEIERTKVGQAELNTRIEYLSSKTGVHPGQALRVEELSQDGLVFELRQSIVDGEGQYNELALRLKPEHPRMRQLRRMIEQTKRALTNRYRKLLGAPETSIESEADSSVEGVKARMLEQLVAALPERIVLETRMNAYQNALVQAKGQLVSMPAEQVQLAELMRAEQVAIETVSETEKSLNQARLVESVSSKTSSYQIIDRPQVSGVTIASKLPKFASALVIGLVFAVAVFFGLDLLDPRLRRIMPVLDTLPLPVIGWISELVPADRVPELREDMHRLRLSIKGLLTGDSNEIVVASADKGDGKSAIAAGLAMSFAESGMKVLLIDANLLEPTQHYVFNLPPSPGLADYLVNPVPDLWQKLMRPVGKNLKVITAGAGPAGVGLLATDAIREMMTIAKAQADVVIFDTPAITDSPAALALISAKSHLLAAVRMNHTLKQSLLILASQLRHHEFASGSMVIADVDEFALASALAKAGRREALELEE
jgi:polysaccharide biosynthesis transport protein